MSAPDTAAAMLVVVRVDHDRMVDDVRATLGVPDTLVDPKLEVFSGSTKVGENDNWTAGDAATFTSVGAFPLTAGSRDAAPTTAAGTSFW